jgi:protein required for attachment to host cells
MLFGLPYHANLAGALVGEIDRDLTGHALHDVENAIGAA